MERKNGMRLERTPELCAFIFYLYTFSRSNVRLKLGNAASMKLKDRKRSESNAHHK